MKRKIAAIILNYVSWKDTLEEVEVCKKKLGLQSQDIVVVDNCSPNESAENLEKESKDSFVFIRSLKNGGYAAGNNIGLKYAHEKGYDYALVINNDIIVEDDRLLDKLVSVFEKDKTVGAVSPDIYSPEGHLFNRDSVKPSLWDFTLGLLNYKRKGRKVTDLGGYGYVYRPQGCCMMLRLDVVNAVDYMDETTFLYCEEFILAEKMNSLGYKCACCLDSSIIHNHSKVVKSNIKLKELISINNESFAYYLKKYRQFNAFFVKICCAFNGLKIKVLEG